MLNHINKLTIARIGALKNVIFILIIFLWVNDGWSQSRMYASAGLTRTNGGPWNIFKDYSQAPGTPYFDFEFDKKLVGPIHFAAGVSYLGIGYSSDDKFFGSAIDFQASYLAIPVLARWNFRNRNYLYLDVGFCPFYLLRANLKEEIDQFNTEKVVEGNISRYSTRLLYYMKLQGSIALSRLKLSAFWIIPFDGQYVTKDLHRYWGLNKEQSTYLTGSDYLPGYYGIKAGFRIK